MTEQEIIDRLRKKDETALKELIDWYQVSLLKLVNGFIHETEEAKEIVQDVFIELYFGIDNFRGDSKLSTWLYRVAVNKSLNQLRRNKKRQIFSRLNPALSRAGNSDIKDTGKVPGEMLERSERITLIRKTINSLPENQRIAFIMNKYQDLSYKEISGVMDITLPAVESLVHRAKINLQKKLAKLHKKNLL